MVYSKPGCCLCDEVKAKLETLPTMEPTELTEKGRGLFLFGLCVRCGELFFAPRKEVE